MSKRLPGPWGLGYVGEVSGSSAYARRSNRFYWILAAILLLGGILAGQLLAPDAWPFWRRWLAGGLMGIWCGFCVFAWHYLHSAATKG